MISSGWTERPSIVRVLQVTARLRGADGRQALAAGGARLRDDVERLRAPMGGHLSPARRRVVCRADGVQQDVVGADAEREDERQVAVVGEEPVVGRAEGPGEPGQERLVARAGDVEIGPALLVEGQLAVVDRPRDRSTAPVVLDELSRRDSAVIGQGSSERSSREAVVALPSRPQPPAHPVRGGTVLPYRL